MAGHSHWAGIKHKKAAIDNKRGKLWSKLSRAIIVAAKGGGGDPDTNLRLRYAIDAAKAVSMPKDNIDRAVKKGSGELDDGSVYEEIIYEGYGPSGVAVMLDILTDNRNRTAGEIRKIFELDGGKMGTTGCVAWMFDRRGVFIVPAEGTDEEELMLHAIEAGALDVQQEGENFHVICEIDTFQDVITALKEGGIEPESTEVSWIPNNTVDLDVEAAKKVLHMMERLDDHDDVQSVSANFNIPDDAMAEIAAMEE